MPKAAHVMHIPKIQLMPFLAPLLERYVTLHRVHPTRTYDYAKRKLFGLEVIEATRHLPKCGEGESWLYVAAPVGADLARLAADEKLYVGSQTQDRMFRGDGLDGDNYHHREMRKGNKDDTPVAFLRTGREVDIYRVTAAKIESMVNRTPELAFLSSIPRQPRTKRTHPGYWFEQYMLLVEPPPLWRWNTATANRKITQILANAI